MRINGVFRGGPWARPAAAGAAPAGALLTLAAVIGAATGPAVHEPTVGWWDRTRMSLAALLQGIGPSLTAKTSLRETGVGYGEAFSSSDGTIAGSGLTGPPSAHASYTVVPLTVTLLWIAVLWPALRYFVRAGGPEAAVRAAVVSAVAALALALAAPLTIDSTRLTPSPVAVVCGALLLGLVTGLAALPAPGRAAWLAARPAARAALRVVTTAALGLVLAVLLCGAIAFAVAVAYGDDITGWGVLAAAVLLPNLGTAGLAVGWGGPLKVTFSLYGGEDSRTTDHTVGLSDLTHVWGGWACVLAVAAGVVCAVGYGVLVSWRTATRGEGFLAAGVFAVLFTALVAVGGASADTTSVFGAARSASGGSDASAWTNRQSVGGGVAFALLFGLLWSVAAVAAGPYVRRALGGGTGPRPALLREEAAYAAAPAYGGAVPPRPAVPPPAVPPQAVPPHPGHPAPPPRPPAGPPAVPPQPAGPPVLDLGLITPECPDKP
ncbi:hypothetical protein [Actinacidiphila alni]|uniref:hypothetical protein n=1 Tax=Actinacidiphila alni TaxID=380248 RepID=UPI003455ED3C